jgi:hypothetical protein
MLVYEERYHWTRASTTALIGGGMFMIIGALARPHGPGPWAVLQVILVAFYGFCVFCAVLQPASRKVALRVDASGITLGGYLLRYNVTTRVIPWDEVQGVFLWQRANGIRYLGVERPDEAPPLSPGGTGRADRTLSFSADPQVPPLTLAAGAIRSMLAFTIDNARLSEAITHYAPAVELVDLG